MEHSLNSIFTQKINTLVFPEINSSEGDLLIENLPFSDYASDNTAISSSGLKELIISPMRFISYLQDKSLDRDKDTDSLQFGRIAHMAILEPAKFKKQFVIEPVFEGLTKTGELSTRSKAAKDAKEKWYSELPQGALVLTQKEMDDITSIIYAISLHDVASCFFKNGKPEISGWWTEPETGVRCRIRPDYLSRDNYGDLHLIDFKTSYDARKYSFMKSIYKYKYHMQMAFYYDGLKQILKEDIKTVNFVACTKGKTECAVYICDDQMLDIGRQWYKFALQTYKKCIELKKWPGIQSRAEVISLPNDALGEEFPEFLF